MSDRVVGTPPRLLHCASRIFFRPFLFPFVLLFASLPSTYAQLVIFRTFVEPANRLSTGTRDSLKHQLRPVQLFATLQEQVRP